jgi:hypothetical protein
MMGGRLLGPCLYCGAPATERHHWTASLLPDGPHLDPTATIPLCVACHHAEHAAWRALGLAVVGDAVKSRILRLDWLLQRLADVAEHTGPRTLDAESQRGLHDVLLALADELGRRLGWEDAS